jgi:hypothetical protein
MKHLSSDPPDAPTVRMGQMKRLHQAQSILNVGPTREEDPRDYSILRNDMPSRENVDAPEKQPLYGVSSPRTGGNRIIDGVKLL